MKDLIGKIQKKKDYGLETCRLVSKSEEIDNPQRLKQRVSAFMQQEGCQGWLCFKSALVLIPQNPLPQENYLQYGELAAGNKGLLIRRSHKYWRLIELEEDRGDEVIVQSCQHLGRPDLWEGQNFNLEYRRYWTLDDTFGPRPYMARFTGFNLIGGAQ